MPCTSDGDNVVALTAGPARHKTQDTNTPIPFRAAAQRPISIRSGRYPRIVDRYDQIHCM